jgi:hypothetical protein
MLMAEGFEEADYVLRSVWHVDERYPGVLPVVRQGHESRDPAPGAGAEPGYRACAAAGHFLAGVLGDSIDGKLVPVVHLSPVF